MWSFFSLQYFFATGHQTTVPTIPWEAAYVGFVGDFPKWMYFVPAMFVTLNTFASSVLCATTLPLLLFWPCFRKAFQAIGAMNDSKTQNSRHSQADKGEFVLFENYDEFTIVLARLFFGYLSIQGIQVRTYVSCFLLW